MPRPYSTDLRERVLHALERSPNRRAQIAAQYEISPSTLYSWQRQMRKEGRAEPRPHAGGPAPRFDLEAVRRAHRETDGGTLREFRRRYEEETGIPISHSSARRLLATLRLADPDGRAGGTRRTSH